MSGGSTGRQQALVDGYGHWWTVKDTGGRAVFAGHGSASVRERPATPTIVAARTVDILLTDDLARLAFQRLVLGVRVLLGKLMGNPWIANPDGG